MWMSLKMKDLAKCCNRATNHLVVNKDVLGHGYAPSFEYCCAFSFFLSVSFLYCVYIMMKYPAKCYIRATKPPRGKQRYLGTWVCSVVWLLFHFFFLSVSLLYCVLWMKYPAKCYIRSTKHLVVNKDVLGHGYALSYDYCWVFLWFHKFCVM